MTLTAVLFAGGESRRMGVDKATLTIGGTPLWARQLERLRRVNPDVLALSARTRPPWCPPELELIPDDVPSRGPLSGLLPALRSLRTSHLLVFAVDLTDMTSVHLNQLWSLAEPGRGVLPVNGSRFEPLCAIYPAEAFVVLKENLSGGDVSLQTAARMLLREDRIGVFAVPETNKSLYHNANTPADLRLRSGCGVDSEKDFILTDSHHLTA